MTVYLVGLDGASLDNLSTVMDRTSLPNFQRLLKEGSPARLRSVYPYVTAPAWASMFSGVNPGKHGIFDMVEIKEGKAVPPNMRNCDVPFIWDYLSWAGKRVLVMGVPFVHPAPRVNGIFITGRFVPKMSCFPEPTRDIYDLSGYEYHTTSPVQKRVGERGLIAEGILDDLKRRIDSSTALIKSEHWDLVVGVDSLPDEMFHLRYSDSGLIDETFSLLDEWLGRILSLIGKGDSILVVSDHGFGDVTRVFYFNEWLRQKGFVREERARIKQLGRMVPAGWPTRQSSPKVKLEPNSLTGPSKKDSQEEPLDYVVRTSPKSKVLTLGISNLVWVRPREEMKDVNQTKTSLLKELDQLKTDGIIANVFTPEQLYSGSHLKDAPAPILVEAGDGWLLNKKEFTHGKLQKKMQRLIGEHTLNGMLVLYGAAWVKVNPSATLLDITPTILDLMRIPYPIYLDGKGLIQSDGDTIVPPQNEKDAQTLPEAKGQFIQN